VLDRKLGEYQLPNGWVVIAAGNPASERGVHFRCRGRCATALFILSSSRTSRTGAGGQSTPASGRRSSRFCAQADPPAQRRCDFRPCFRWLEKRGITPQTLVFLTDLWGTFPIGVPPYPVLWASTGKREALFGQVIPMGAA
jgi:hypothetical protein